MLKEIKALIQFRDSCHDDWGDYGAWRTLDGLREIDTDRFPEEHQQAHLAFLKLDKSEQQRLVYETLRQTDSIEILTQVIPEEFSREEVLAAVKSLGIQVYTQQGKIILSKVDLDEKDIQGFLKG